MPKCLLKQSTSNSTDGEPCNECHICKGITQGTNSDVIEIDAASNNGVDEIRNIRDKVKYAPSESKYKVYIIDEVHMLTTGAFNALLKTLEEPPHTLFLYWQRYNDRNLQQSFLGHNVFILKQLA